MEKLLHPFKGIVLLAVVLFSCEKKTGSDSGIVYSGKTAMRVTHSVKSYADWLKVYKEVSDSNSWIGVYVSPEDPNLVTVYELTENHEEAKKEFSSGRMRRLMKRAGVSSEPIINYFDITFRTIPKSERLYRVEITHDVADYDTWKKMFDESEPRREALGLELRGIFIDADDPNLVGIVFATDDIDKLKAMMESEEYQKWKHEGEVASREMVTFLKMPSIK